MFYAINHLKKKKWIQAVGTFIFLLLFTCSPIALANSYNQVMSIPTITTGEGKEIGTVKIVAEAGTIPSVTNNVILRITLPSDAEIGSSGLASGAVSEPNPQGVYNFVYVPSENNALQAVDISTSVVNNNILEIRSSKPVSENLDLTFFVTLKDINIDDHFSGELKITIDPPSNSGFAAGTYTVANVIATSNETPIHSICGFIDDPNQIDVRQLNSYVYTLTKDIDNAKELSKVYSKVAKELQKCKHKKQ